MIIFDLLLLNIFINKPTIQQIGSWIRRFFLLFFLRSLFIRSIL